MTNDAKPTEVNHGFINDVYTAPPKPVLPCSLSLPLRGRHVPPNRTWSTSLSPTSQRRMVPHVVRGTPTPTIECAAHEQWPSVPDDESTATAQAAIAQVVPATPAPGEVEKVADEVRLYHC
jgi:hypothetical protein